MNMTDYLLTTSVTAEALSPVFEEAVRVTCCKDYTPGQVEAWVQRATSSRFSHDTYTFYFFHVLNKQVYISLFCALHVSSHTSDGHIIQQFFFANAHDIHRHLAGYEFYSIVDSLLAE